MTHIQNTKMLLSAIYCDPMGDYILCVLKMQFAHLDWFEAKREAREKTRRFIFFLLFFFHFFFSFHSFRNGEASSHATSSRISDFLAPVDSFIGLYSALCPADVRTFSKLKSARTGQKQKVHNSHFHTLHCTRIFAVYLLVAPFFHSNGNQISCVEQLLFIFFFIFLLCFCVVDDGERERDNEKRQKYYLREVILFGWPCEFRCDRCASGRLTVFNRLLKPLCTAHTVFQIFICFDCFAADDERKSQLNLKSFFFFSFPSFRLWSEVCAD